MKNKKMTAILVAVCLLQLIFPVGLILYERSFMESITENGESYTLEYTNITHFNKEVLSLNTADRHTVGYRWDFENAKEDELPHDTVSVYSEVGISKREDGTVDFFTIEGKERTDYNWFRTYDAFSVEFEDYEFVRDDFGMKELYDFGLLLSEDTTNDFTFEKFMQSEDGYYNGIWHIPLEGKIILSVYKGFAVIKEVYIGNELILRHK